MAYGPLDHDLSMKSWTAWLIEGFSGWDPDDDGTLDPITSTAGSTLWPVLDE